MPGPFEVDPSSIGQLGGQFASFVNDLLVAEVGRTGLLGFQLDINTQPNTPDGGVDASLWSAEPTDWLPAGKSAWQFKSSDLEPAECRSELHGAQFVKELMQKGATYVLVIGRPLVSAAKDRRLEALRTTAKSLGLNGDEVRLYDGHQLARWVSSLPALALDRRLGGTGPTVLDFERWSSSPGHDERWVPCPSRAEIEKAIAEVSTGSQDVYRVEGGSGLGKTRLVMETLRDAPVRPLVVYAPRADQLQTETLSYLCSGERTSVLVVDNCSRANHQSIVEQIDNRHVRLITIGAEGTDRLIQTPLRRLHPAETDEVDRILRENVPGLWPEARRVVSENCFGNIRTALLLGDRLLQSGDQNLASLFRESDFPGFIEALLPEQADLFTCKVLALLERVGWDRDRGDQLERLCQFSNVQLDVAENTARVLESAELLASVGRYRSIIPQPLAVYLAASAWEYFGNRILDELVPMCDTEMLAALLQRAAEIGRFAPVQEVLQRLLSREGPFGSLSKIEAANVEFLVQLAIVLPERVTTHLHELIESEPLDTLRELHKPRRALVRTLEKLVWHSDTFSRAADCLLRLATAENETYSNNASGVWCGLFAASLPMTSATPAHRLRYLVEHATDSSRQVRSLVVRAAAHVLRRTDFVIISGELQEGTIVEPRGSAPSIIEAIDYWTQVINLLESLYADADADIVDAVETTLVAALHPFLNLAGVGARLREVILGMDSRGLLRARDSLIRIIEMHSDDSDLVVLAAKEFLVQLPSPKLTDRLHSLIRSSPWRWNRADSTDELDELIDEAVKDGSVAIVAQWLQEERLLSAWRLGYAIGARSDHRAHRSLVLGANDDNTSALAGFLSAVDLQEPGAFDRFLEVEEGRSMPDTKRLSITAAGPPSDRAIARIAELSRSVSVAKAASSLISWQQNLTTEATLDCLRDWLGRLNSESDYAAVVEWLHILILNNVGLPDALNAITLDLLRQRSRFPNIDHQRYEWCSLAAALATKYPAEITREILQLISEAGLIFLSSGYEADVLQDVVAAAPKQTWELVASRIEEGDWRVAMILRGWFTEMVPTTVILDWIGQSEERAENVAEVASAGGDQPSELAVYLLGQYPENSVIAQSLAAEFKNGAWTGRWSGHLGEQISQLESWRQEISLPKGVRTWAAMMIDDLQIERQEALEREAERGY